MFRRWALWLAAVLVCLAASPALAEKYGITDELQSFFGREEEELPDGTVKVTYFGAGSLEATLGTYTVLVKDGKADISWSLEGKDTAGGYEAEAWGLEQLKQMAEERGRQAANARRTALYERLDNLLKGGQDE